MYSNLSFIAFLPVSDQQKKAHDVSSRGLIAPAGADCGAHPELTLADAPDARKSVLALARAAR
jgi:hypothetical protein